jgi:DNA processing protein
VSSGGWTIERGCAEYPPGLLDLADAPAALHGIGSRTAIAGLTPGRTVSVVGARRATEYGRRVAEELASGLASAGVTVVSGMAFGIDAAAHRGALAAGGTTVAVLAGGADVAYPPSSAGLHRRIVTAGGASVSEALPGVVPARWQFPARNRLMAALSEITVVVEAALRSGSRHTSDAAIALQRTVAAVPGDVRSPVSAGPHELLRDGALLVRDAQDVLDELLGVGATSVRRVGPDLDSEQIRVLELVERGAATADALAAKSRPEPRRMAVALAHLELAGYVRADAVGRIMRTDLQPP